MGMKTIFTIRIFSKLHESACEIHVKEWLYLQLLLNEQQFLIAR